MVLSLLVKFKLSSLYQIAILFATEPAKVAGQSHLNNPIQNALEILMIPASLETLGMNANTR
ncbi:MAG: hypothetical protein NVSMB49_24110 [Ktedonobacteraceae bacterium]